MPKQPYHLNLKSLQPSIETIPEMNMVVKSTTMSYAEDQTATLWRSFGPLIKNIPFRMGQDKYAIHIYPDAEFFENFQLGRMFQKFAAVQVSEFGELPDGLEALIIPAGQYAVFHYVGKPSEATDTFKYIFFEWLPNSDYVFDARPQMAHMGDLYKGENPETEELFFIPIRRKC